MQHKFKIGDCVRVWSIPGLDIHKYFMPGTIFKIKYKEPDCDLYSVHHGVHSDIIGDYFFTSEDFTRVEDDPKSSHAWGLVYKVTKELSTVKFWRTRAEARTFKKYFNIHDQKIVKIDIKYKA